MAEVTVPSWVDFWGDPLIPTAAELNKSLDLTIYEITNSWKETPVDRRESILNRLASLEAELAELDKWGDDVYPDGTVIKWKKTFPPRTRKYRFAALRAGGYWYLTNRDGYRMTWSELVSMLSHSDSFDHKVSSKWKSI